MEEVKVIELPEKPSMEISDYIIVETKDGTKKVLVQHFKSLVLNTIYYFSNIKELKEESYTIGLKEGDICETLGYYTPGDGGGAKYRITYNPGAAEDNRLVHHLSYSDTLRAEIILNEIINVHQFGAYGDGYSDDTTAIQAAIDNSYDKIIEFGNNKTYITRQPLRINRSNIVINGNSAILYPHYVDGIDISPEYEESISNVVINYLHFNCARATSAYSINDSYKIDINGSFIANAYSKGVIINNSGFVNIDKCYLSGSKNSSLILLQAEDATKVVSLSGRAINITNCVFGEFFKAIHVLSTANQNNKLNTVVNATNCRYCSNTIGSACFYLACPIEILNIDSSVTEKCNTFLYFGGASSGTVSCRNISCLNTDVIFNVGTADGILNLTGTINTDGYGVMFDNMIGKLHSNIAWDFIPKGANYSSLPIGELFDSNHPLSYNADSGYSIADSTLTLLEARNIYIDWNNSTSDILDIENGIKGQMIYIRSSNNKNIKLRPNKIVLSDSSIKLSYYKGVLLKHDGNKWVQVQ